jgi:hypothetical protein
MIDWPSGVISSEIPLTEAQMKELKTNAKPQILPAGMTWKPITVSMERWYLDHERMYLGQQP